ncbi:hypothetical protein RhiirA1_452643 [Rhizophagus irregularis]|uniref:Uncharacterized protein n=1 Tax=Rhizophagus irregularis TaxID=588596 RepID=A0A2N0S9F0_9GLOM|nr:hypothetical protein RhiirA1_452643 [Rhizophagus irregularis]
MNKNLFDFDQSSKIETVFDAATGFMIPLIIYLSLNYGMNIYLFGSFIILAMADMGLTILFTHLSYIQYNNNIFFWIYFIFIAPIYIINYLLILKESNFFNKSFLRNDKREINKMEKYIKKRLIPLTLFIINLIFLGIAIHYQIVDFINGLFIIIPSLLLFIVYFGFIIFYDESKKKSNGLTHLRFFVEFMCSIIFVMITGPSVLWIKCYLSITVVEMSLYLERAKPSDSKLPIRYRLDNFIQCRDLLLNLHNNNNNDDNNNDNDDNNNDDNNDDDNNDNEKIKNFVIELHVNHKKEENNDVQILTLNVVDV